MVAHLPEVRAEIAEYYQSIARLTQASGGSWTSSSAPRVRS